MLWPRLDSVPEVLDRFESRLVSVSPDTELGHHSVQLVHQLLRLSRLNGAVIFQDLLLNTCAKAADSAVELEPMLAVLITDKPVIWAKNAASCVAKTCQFKVSILCWS